MASVYLGYFVEHKPKELYEIFVVGNNKEEAYKRYCDFHESANLGKYYNLEKLPIEKLHYNGEIIDTDPSILESIIDSDYPKVFFNDDTSNTEEDFIRIMSDEYIDYHPSNVNEEE